MLVLTRERGNSIIVDGSEGSCLLTVLEVRAAEISLLVSHSPNRGNFEAWTTTLVRDSNLKVGATADVTLVDVREEKARLGINASKQSSIHRLEVWQAIRAANRAACRDPDRGKDDGPAGSPVPRPGGPKPPSLDVRLNEPQPPDDEKQ